MASKKRGTAVAAAAAEVPGPEPAPAKRARVVSQTRRMIGPKNRPASARPDSHLKLNTALHQLHPDFDGTRKFPRGRGIMPSFLLENIDGNDVTNENHEAFEQFVVCWLFNEIIPRTCRVPGKVDAKGKCVSVDETKPSIRVLELGGGIGAVSTMIQQNLQMVDQDAPHVVVEPNALLSDGPLLRNRLRHGSRFDVIRGVVSSKEKVAFGLGDVNQQDRRGQTPLHAAVRAKQLGAAAFLLDHGADVHLTDKDGMTAKLYEGMAEEYDEDESYLYYEWQNIPANYNPLHTLLPQIHMPAFDPSIRVALHMGDESWFELTPSIDTEFDFGHSYDLDVAKFLKLLDTCVNFT